MKNIFKLTALAVFLCCLVSCDDDEPIIPTLEVTPANLNGTWELSEWNGTPLAEGTYCYVVSTARNRLLKCTRSSTACMPATSPEVSVSKTTLIWARHQRRV